MWPKFLTLAQLNGLIRWDCSSFPVCGPSLRGAGFHGPYQVESDNAKHQLGAVSVIALRRQAIEREAVLEITGHLLVGVPSAHEEP